MKSDLEIQIKITELKMQYAVRWFGKNNSIASLFLKTLDTTPAKIEALQWVLGTEKQNKELLKEKQLYEQQIAEAQKRIEKINELINKNAL